MVSRLQRMSASQIIKYAQIDPDIFNARYVSLRSVQPKVFKSQGANNTVVKYQGYYCTTVTHEPHQRARIHKQNIWVNDASYTGALSVAPSVMVSCDCLIGETRVLTDKGWQSIFSLLDPTSNPALDFPVKYVVNDKEYVGSVPFYKGRKPVWKISIDNGQTLTATKKHKILVYKGMKQLSASKAEKIGSPRLIPKYKWVEVRNLKIGDKLSITQSKSVPKVDQDFRYWQSYFAGAFYGDGTFNPFSIEVHGWKNILANISKAGVSYKRQSKGRYILSYQAKEILSALDMMNPKRRHHISDKINLYSFLSGLIDTDGYVRSDNAVLITGTKHLKTLSDKLQALGLPGVKFYLYRNKGDKTNIGSTTKDSYALRISAQSMAMLSPNLCSVKCADIDFGRDFSYNKQNVAKIIGIEYAGRQHVYDIHVPKVNRFVAESVVVHNCERHVYKWEYALWHHGASQIIFGNGKPPVLTNPSLVPGCCKHVYRILTAMRNRKL